MLPLLTGQGRRHHGDILRRTTRLVEEGELRTSLSERQFTLRTAFDAYRAIAERQSRGKVAIDIG